MSEIFNHSAVEFKNKENVALVIFKKDFELLQKYILESSVSFIVLESEQHALCVAESLPWDEYYEGCLDWSLATDQWDSSRCW